MWYYLFHPFTAVQNLIAWYRKFRKKHPRRTYGAQAIAVFAFLEHWQHTFPAVKTVAVGSASGLANAASFASSFFA